MELVAMQYHGRSNKHFSYMYCTLTNSSLESQILIWVQIESIAADRSKLQSSSICKSVDSSSSKHPAKSVIVWPSTSRLCNRARDRPTTINETKMNVTAARTVLTSATRLVSGTTAAAGRAFSSTTVASASDKTWKIYLSGEIHSDWREVIAKGVAEKNLPVSLSSPNTSHEDSDDCGAIILGSEKERRNWDKLGANMNNLRTKTLIKDADIVVVRFGPKYRQCKYSFDLTSHFISRR